MTVGDFAYLVAKMRDAQKRYFRSHSKEVLNEAKVWEARVDAVLKEREERQAETAQPKLVF